MHQLNAGIVSNKKVGERCYHCLLRAPRISSEARPGQFVTIRLDNGSGPLLRRPLSIHRVAGATIELLYEVVGPATLVLSGKKKGERLDMIGPLGAGFDYQDLRSAPVIVAGGMGVAPLVFLAERLKAQSPAVLIGARTKQQLLCEKDFQQLGCDVTIATDDGSAGYKGKVTDVLQRALSAAQGQRPAVFACGPRPMLKEVSRIASRLGIPAQVSLEEHMACGIGACLGCVVGTKDGFQRVCKEGPVFEADKLVWDQRGGQ